MTSPLVQMQLASPPHVSVCIANYNGGTLVLRCLASVYEQKGNFELEVVLHDDCSTDDSLALISQEFPDVNLLRSKTNVGFCVSNNRMVEFSNSEYVLLLNNDALLRPGSIDCLLKYAMAHGRDNVLGLPQYLLADGKFVDQGYRTDLFLNPIPVFIGENHVVGVATGACLWIPRKVWDDVGGFPPWFESIAEDIFFCFASRLLGYKVVVLDSPGFDHWIGKNLGGGKVIARKLSTTVRRRTLSERNKTFVIFMCYPALALAVITPLHFILLAAEALFLLISGTEPSKIKKIYLSIPKSLWVNRKNICMLRSQLMHKRKCSFRSIFSHTNILPHKLNMLFRHGKPELK